MNAILLAAGYGTRLRPLTNTTPKCLVPIKGKPLLGIWIEKLTKIGVNKFLVNTHYLSDQVENFIEQSSYREKVTLVHEDKLLGTAGTLRSNLDFYEDSDGILIHADNYCEDSLEGFLSAHMQRGGCDLTMLTFRTDDPSSCGIVKLDENNIVVEYYEKKGNPPGNLANAAIYILSKKFIKDFKKIDSRNNDFSKDVIGNYINRIYTYETNKIFYDIGTYQKYNLVK